MFALISLRCGGAKCRQRSGNDFLLKKQSDKLSLRVLFLIDTTEKTDKSYGSSAGDCKKLVSILLFVVRRVSTVRLKTILLLYVVLFM